MSYPKGLIWHIEHWLMGWVALFEGLAVILTFGLFSPSWEMKYALWWSKRQARRMKASREKMGLT